MRLSAKAEYACIALLDLAAGYAEPQPMPVKAIADAHSIDQRFLVQILLQLKTAGLVMSTRGASGGYKLARPPHDITLADVIEVVAGDPPIRFALEESSSHTVEAVHNVWKEIQTYEQRILEQTSLAELLRRARESHALSYQI
jgi:Rrf2 family protein